MLPTIPPATFRMALHMDGLDGVTRGETLLKSISGSMSFLSLFILILSTSLHTKLSYNISYQISSHFLYLFVSFFCYFCLLVLMRDFEQPNHS